MPPRGGLAARERPVFGLRPAMRFALVATLTLAHTAFSVWFSQPWRAELEDALGPVMSWVIPVLLAYVPGVVIGFLCATLILTRYRPPPLDPPAGPWPTGEWPPVTVIVAAYNEESAVEATLDHIAATTYPGPLDVVLADNNSTDRTAELGAAAAARHGLDYRRCFEAVAGKHHALNTALVDVTTPIVVTVDADTLLHPEALTYLIARVTTRPQDQHVCACAGALIAENANHNFLTRMQGWDYRLGINGVKRTQAAYNSALVAQGAFSAYWTDDLRAVGGWPDAIGEDIVLTWSLMSSRGLVQYEPVALAATVVPERRRSPHEPAVALGARDDRGHPHQSAAPPAAGPRQARRRDRLPRAAARHRLRVLLDPRRDPVHLRLPAAVLVVVDARDPDHAAGLRAASRLAGPHTCSGSWTRGRSPTGAASGATCSAIRR